MKTIFPAFFSRKWGRIERVMLIVPSKLVLRRASHPSELSFVDKGFSDSRRAACYQPGELWHGRFKGASFQECGSSTNFSRVEPLGEKTSRLGVFDSEKVFGKDKGESKL
jgi:hypothetical protein